MCARPNKVKLLKVTQQYIYVWLHNKSMAGEQATTRKLRSGERQNYALALSSESSPSSLPIADIILDTDYIPPLERVLGPHETKIGLPQPAFNRLHPVDFHLQKLIALIITASPNKPGITSEFLEGVSHITAGFISTLINSLHKFTEAQRHMRPGVADLELCLEDQGISVNDLHNEYLRTRKLDTATRQLAGTLLRKLDATLRDFNATDYSLDKDDPSLVFHANEQHEIAALVPRHVKRREYIPEYLPDLPPDFTFTLTGNFMSTVTDLKEIRLRLAEELRLNEQSLYRLIDDNSKGDEIELSELTSESESDLDDIMSVASDKNLTDIEAPDTVVSTLSDKVVSIENGKKFDFIQYAQIRRHAKERRIKEIERRRKLRQRNIFLKAEAVLSPFASPLLPENSLNFKSIIQQRLKKTIKSIRTAESEKKARLAALMDEKRKLEDEQTHESGKLEFGFSFDTGSKLTDESDEDESDVEVAHLDFGDNGEPKDISLPAEAVAELDFIDGDGQPASVATFENGPETEAVATPDVLTTTGDKEDSDDELESMLQDIEMAAPTETIAADESSDEELENVE